MSVEGPLPMSKAIYCSELEFRKVISFNNLPSAFGYILDWLATPRVFGSDLL